MLDLVDHELINLPFAQFVVDDGLIGQPAGQGFDRFAGLIGPPLGGEHAHAQRQQFFGEILVVAEHHGALDGVFQFAHVAGPGIAQQHVEHVPADPPQLAVVLARCICRGNNRSAGECPRGDFAAAADRCCTTFSR